MNDAFQYTGAGLAITAVAARAMFRNGFAFRVMSANPCEYPVHTVPCLSMMLTGLFRA